MVQTSKDFLFITLGVAVLVISFFWCLLLYYLIRVAKDLYKTTAFLKKMQERIDEIIKSIKGKVQSFSLMPLLSEGIRMAVDFMREKRKEKNTEEKIEKKEEEK